MSRFATEATIVDKRTMTARKRRRMKVFPGIQARRNGPTCIDIFAGAGGLAEGFHAAGWRIMSATDHDSYASETFRRNFPEATFFEGPVDLVRPAKLLEDAGLLPGELDCLIGGPPCQSYSYNNHLRSATDERARLFREYLRLVRALLPVTLVMENVPGMLTIGHGEVVRVLTRELNRLGYEVRLRIIYCEDFGIPQQRRRVFLIATLLGWEDSLFPPGTHGPREKPSERANPHIHRWQPPRVGDLPDFVTVWDAIGDLPALDNGEAIGDGAAYTAPATAQYQRLMRRGSDGIHNHVAHVLQARNLERIAHVPEGGNWRDVPFELLPAGMRRAREKDHTTRYGRLLRDGLATTILTKCDPHWGCYVHPLQDRTITVREAARLQAFSDRFQFRGPTSEQYVQVGNAVPPLVASALATAIKRHITRWRRQADAA